MLLIWAPHRSLSTTGEYVEDDELKVAVYVIAPHETVNIISINSNPMYVF